MSTRSLTRKRRKSARCLQSRALSACLQRRLGFLAVLPPQARPTRRAFCVPEAPPRPFEHHPRRFKQGSRRYEHRPRPFEHLARRFEQCCRPFERACRAFEQGYRRYEQSLRHYEHCLRRR